jgi:chromosome segregation ATPase
MNKPDLSAEKKTLVQKRESLEQENKALANQLENLNLRLSEKRKEANMLSERSYELKKTLMDCISEEKDLLHEIEFLDSEKAKLVEIYEGVTERYDTNMSVLEGMIKDIGFMKGEIGALIIKMGMLEEEIPDRFRDADNLDKKITGTFIRALNDLQNRLNAVERKAKVLYYKKENI